MGHPGEGLEKPRAPPTPNTHQCLGRKLCAVTTVAAFVGVSGQGQRRKVRTENSGIGANTINPRDGESSWARRDTDGGTQPPFWKAGSKVALSCGQRNKKEVGLPEIIELTSEVPRPVCEPQVCALG